MSRKNKAQRHKASGESAARQEQSGSARRVCTEAQSVQSVQELKNPDSGKVIGIQFADSLDAAFAREKKIIPPTIKEMLKVMQADPITALRDNAQAKQLATRKISELEAEIRRADSEISTILVRSKGFEAEIIALICNADDQDGRTIARVASTAQIESLHYRAGYGELFK